MSRIGNKHIILPEGISLKIENDMAIVSGKNGTLTVKIPHKIHVNINGNTVVLTRDDDNIQTKELHGTTRALIASAVEGIHKFFEKTLLISGTGYRAKILGDKLVLKVGYSHENTIVIPSGITIKINDKDGTNLTVSGINKEEVGQIAATIRDVRRPEPYGGKGIRYSNEQIIHKEGKRAAAATGGGASAKK